MIFVLQIPQIPTVVSLPPACSFNVCWSMSSRLIFYASFCLPTTFILKFHTVKSAASVCTNIWVCVEFFGNIFVLDRENKHFRFCHLTKAHFACFCPNNTASNELQTKTLSDYFWSNFWTQLRLVWLLLKKLSCHCVVSLVWRFHKFYPSLPSFSSRIRLLDNTNAIVCSEKCWSEQSSDFETFSNWDKRVTLDRNMTSLNGARSATGISQ